MNKKISQAQIDTILKAMYSLNPPVQLYMSVQKVFNELPILSDFTPDPAADENTVVED